MSDRPRHGSLDDLRAVAISMVLACHLASHFYHRSPLDGVFSVGGRGVDLFFVLSGWLLGGQLFREASDTGTVNVRRFWVRRWLRTLPAYYAVLAVVTAYLWATGKGHLLDWRYAVFLQNYLPLPPYLGVTWSLCVEEHFYLAVGPAVWLAYRFRWGAALVLAAIVGLLTVHALGWYPRDPETHQTFVSQVRWEPCGVGVGLAWLAVRRPGLWTRLQKWAWPLFAVSIGLLVLNVVNRVAWDWAIPDWGPLVWGALFGTWVLLAVSVPGWRDRPASRVSRYLATRAYALYLLHPEGIAVAQKVSALPTEGQAVLAVVVAGVAAEGLYRLVERPFMRMRDRPNAGSPLPALRERGRG